MASNSTYVSKQSPTTTEPGFADRVPTQHFYETPNGRLRPWGWGKLTDGAFHAGQVVEVKPAHTNADSHWSYEILMRERSEVMCSLCQCPTRQRPRAAISARTEGQAEGRKNPTSKRGERRAQISACLKPGKMRCHRRRAISTVTQSDSRRAVRRSFGVV